MIVVALRHVGKLFGWGMQFQHPAFIAVLTALVGSGFPAESFYYGGFLPVKSGQRERELTRAAARAETSVFFESPHRLVRALEDAVEVLPGRDLCVARELTKKFEEFRRGRAEVLLAHYQAHPPKGEICLVIEGRTKKNSQAEREETTSSDISE